MKKICASSWLNTEINILRCTVSKTSKNPYEEFILIETVNLYTDVDIKFVFVSESQRSCYVTPLFFTEVIPMCFHWELLSIKVTVKHNYFITIRVATCFDLIGSSSGLHYETLKYIHLLTVNIFWVPRMHAALWLTG